MSITTWHTDQRPGTGDSPGPHEHTISGTPLTLDALADTNLARIVSRLELHDPSAVLEQIKPRSLTDLGKIVVRSVSRGHTTGTITRVISTGWIVRAPEPAAPTDHGSTSETTVPEDGSTSALATVQNIATNLALPATDVCTATGIAWRTYQSWTPTTRPRLASQGRLWQLARLAHDLQQLTDGASRTWMLEHPQARELIVDGHYDAVLDLLLAERSREGRYTDPAAPEIATGPTSDMSATDAPRPAAGHGRRRTGAATSRGTTTSRT